MTDDAPITPADPLPPEPILTPAQLVEAKRYGRLSLIWGLAGQGVDLLFLVLLAFVFGHRMGG